MTERPESVVGTLFSPVPMMKLCELVRGYKTSDESLERARVFAENVGKTVVVVNRDVAGFVTTRLITLLCMEAVRLVETGIMSAGTSTLRAAMRSVTRWVHCRRPISLAWTS